jgi:exo-beta-1,3-glucanase (GH17 family)
MENDTIIHKILIWHERLMLSTDAAQKKVAIDKIKSLQDELRTGIDMSILNDDQKIYYEERVGIYEDSDIIMSEFLAYNDTIEYYCLIK